MNALRNTSLLRIIAGLLTFCLGAVILSPAATAEGIGTRYADWLRLHLPESTQPEFERALKTASESRARSFEEFLTSFLDELESVTKWNEPIEMDRRSGEATERMRTELRLQFVRFVGEAILPTFLKGDVLVQQAASENIRFDKARPYSASYTAFNHPQYSRLLDLQPIHICFGFLRSSAQPLGP